MNAQKGILPHGWLEYTDESSNRPYYYNVHTKVRPTPCERRQRSLDASARCTADAAADAQVTTWYKPAMRKSTVAHVNEPMDESDGGMISVDCAVDTHTIAMSGDL